jgi:hypothetical protein
MQDVVFSILKCSINFLTDAFVTMRVDMEDASCSNKIASSTNFIRKKIKVHYGFETFSFVN